MTEPTQSTETLPPVVTVFETYGAGADAVGSRVAERLQVPFWAQAFSSEQLEAEAEQREKESVLARVFHTMGRSYGTFDVGDIAEMQRDRNELVVDNNRKVWEEARAGGVVMGRNGAIILRHRPHTLHVLLDAPLQIRLARAAQAAGISLERAAKRQVREDAVRAEMSLELYGWDPRQTDRYDLVLNTGQLSIASCVDIIVAAARIKADQRE